ncbi:UDP-N-acetylmuramate dehydrogenase [Azotosporobacter soli]|uniref:UDP-N-acetylmuramate dehydrogenase n=1 Tax=Azotosporobacter soli TaxID=3055040 RepID=UPI003D16106D
MIKNKMKNDFEAVIASERIAYEAPLAEYTTFKIGGPADVLAFPISVAEVAALVRIAAAYAMKITVLGNGSNILVRDKGIRGLVLKFGDEMAQIRRQGNVLIAGAGTGLGDLARFAAQEKMTGMEFSVGIPGSVGGAVFMNAGAYNGEISAVVESVTAVTLTGEIQKLSRPELKFSYRHSVFQESHAIICEVELGLADGQEEMILAQMGEFTEKRESKQPLEMPSAGSTFKRPEGHFAGTLIEAAGLKGLRYGGAEVSTKHAGFVVNAGGATAADVQALIKEVQHRVFEHAGVMLHPEVRIIGDE